MEEGSEGELLSFLGTPVPEAFALRFVAVLPGSERAYREGEWRDSLVVVEQGEVELECLSGKRCRFGPGGVLSLGGLSLRTLRNRGDEPVLLVAVSRR